MSHYFTEPSATEKRRTVDVRFWDTEWQFTTANEVFSADGLDLGTSVLLRESSPPAGDAPATAPAQAASTLQVSWRPISVPKASCRANAGCAAAAGWVRIAAIRLRSRMRACCTTLPAMPAVSSRSRRSSSSSLPSS